MPIIILKNGGGDIGEVFVSSVYDVPCMYVRVFDIQDLSLIHISEPTRQAEISYAVFCLKKKK